MEALLKINMGEMLTMSDFERAKKVSETRKLSMDETFAHLIREGLRNETAINVHPEINPDADLTKRNAEQVSTEEGA